MLAGDTDRGRGSSSGSDGDGRRAAPRRSGAGRRRVAAGVVAVLAAGLVVPVSAGPAWAQNPPPAVDYDVDDDGLIEVSSLAQLNAIRWDLDGDGTADVYPPDIAGRTGHDPDGATKHAAAFPNAVAGMGCTSDGCVGYELAADLDFDTNANGQADAGDAFWNGGLGWLPLMGGEAIRDWDADLRFMDYAGTSGPNSRARMFTAVFEGNGRTISNLFIDDPDRRYVGLFSYVGPGGHVRNVGLPAPNSDSGVRGDRHVGALAGTVEGGIVSGVWSDVDVTGSRTEVGGLVGASWNFSAVVESYATGDVTGMALVGGLIGILNAGPGAVASYATGDVTARCVAGGLIGRRIDGHIRAAYATGSVTATGASRCKVDGVFVRSVGGLLGSMWAPALVDWPRASYAIGQVSAPQGAVFVGGLGGQIMSSPISPGEGSNLWDVETSGQAASPGLGVGYTTAQLQAPTGYTGIYADWDEIGPGDDPWDFGSSSQYPVLKYCGDKSGIDTADGEPYCPLDPVRQRSGGATIEVVPVADTPEPPGYTVDAGVVAKVEYLASQVHHGSAHVNRWQRVLAAFGTLDAAGVTGGAMTAEQAQHMANTHSSPVWDEVVAELTALESAQATQDTPAQDAPVPDEADAVPVVVPEISVAAGGDVSEGSGAVFTISAAPAPSAALDVSVTVSASGEWGAAGGARTVTFAAGAATATLTVPTVDDGVDEADGSVSVSLDAPAADAGYTVSAAQGAASVGVADDDVDPLTVYMIFFSTSIDENGAGYGNQAQFAIAPTRALRSWETLTVPLSVTGGEEGANWTMRNLNDPDAVFANEFEVTFGPGVDGVVLEPGDQRVELVLTAVDDSDWDDHEITVSYGTGPRAPTLNGSTDGVTLGISWGPDGTERADGSTTVVIIDSDEPPPQVSITAATGGTEGTAATFTVTASAPVAAALDVDVTVSATGDWGATTGTQTVTIPQGAAQATLTVATVDDSTDEPDGSITATLAAGSGYTVGAQPTQTAQILDDDDPPPEPAVAACTGKPRVSVADAAAQRGDDLEFVISLSCRSSGAVTVYYFVAYGADITSVRTIGIAGGDTEATVNVPTAGVNTSVTFHVVYTIGAANYSTQAAATITG
ncbi:GLUG motif-containing protein [Candidatus Poriferisodalis sp.]|uniref:GLUG motif-containing protein n=1 Tax=Candidatus Poriferisodalis sp. TaxID=3101277 RepID=UPI003B02C2D5